MLVAAGCVSADELLTAGVHLDSKAEPPPHLDAAVPDTVEQRVASPTPEAGQTAPAATEDDASEAEGSEASEHAPESDPQEDAAEQAYRAARRERASQRKAAARKHQKDVDGGDAASTRVAGEQTTLDAASSEPAELVAESPAPGSGPAPAADAAPVADLPASDLSVSDLPVPSLEPDPVDAAPVADLPVSDLPVADLPASDLSASDLPVPSLEPDPPVEAVFPSPGPVYTDEPGPVDNPIGVDDAGPLPGAHEIAGLSTSDAASLPAHGGAEVYDRLRHAEERLDAFETQEQFRRINDQGWWFIVAGMAVLLAAVLIASLIF